jgi:carboxymethylenebutenolidase
VVIHRVKGFKNMPDIVIPAQDGRSFSAYLAVPAQTPAPAVIMIQEIFGVNTEMREKCDQMAVLGYVAIAPDLFWRMEPGVQLSDQTDKEWARAMGLFARFDIDLGIEDLRMTLHTMRGHAETTGKVGCVGYCLGGKLAYLMATHTKIDAAVSYYGVGLDALTDEAAAITKPLMLHIAEEDQFVDKTAQNKIKQALSANPLVTLHSYPGVNHAFARIHGQHYNEAAAMSANARTKAFLDTTLKSQKPA